MTDEAAPYQVKPDAKRFLVVDDSGRTIMACGDEHSATGYVVLLNEAYRRGYKAGYRHAKEL